MSSLDDLDAFAAVARHRSFRRAAAERGVSASTLSQLNPFEGWTNKFIFPPYDFSVPNCMITNFHTPKSTLLMMVSAFCGHDLMKRAYEEAIKEGYRFYSYGDAMLIL